MRRVRKDHTCLSLKLDTEHLCDKCKDFQQRSLGVSGRKPRKGSQPKCEKPWFLKSTTYQQQRTIEKKGKQLKY